MPIQPKYLSRCIRRSISRGGSRKRTPQAWLFAGLLVFFANALAAQEAATPLPRADGTLEVKIEGIVSTSGLVYASLFSSADGFPDGLDQAFANQAVMTTETENGTLVLLFENVPAGNFAISVFHDADSDGKLDTNFLGIPTEDYGFSQNPPSRFGPPSFDKAAVSLAAGETKQLTITLK